MSQQFFERPILNSPYEYPSRHWELDASGQPTDRVVERQRPVAFISPIPRPKKQKDESGRIAVKVINHLGDDVMKVFRV